jgi:hypothetical protein
MQEVGGEKITVRGTSAVFRENKIDCRCIFPIACENSKGHGTDPANGFAKLKKTVFDSKIKNDGSDLTEKG